MTQSGNRTRDLLACSAVPQPTAPPRAPYLYTYVNTLPYTTYVHDIRHRQRGRRNSYRSNTLLCHTDAICMPNNKGKNPRADQYFVTRAFPTPLRHIPFTRTTLPFRCMLTSELVNYVIACVFSFIRATLHTVFDTSASSYLPSCAFRREDPFSFDN